MKKTVPTLSLAIKASSYMGHSIAPQEKVTELINKYPEMEVEMSSDDGGDDTLEIKGQGGKIDGCKNK